jgi:hypothetical protein
MRCNANFNVLDISFDNRALQSTKSKFSSSSQGNFLQNKTARPKFCITAQWMNCSVFIFCSPSFMSLVVLVLE